MTTAREPAVAGKSASRSFELFIQLLVLIGTVAAAYIAWGAWQHEVHRKRVDTTLEYLKNLTEQTYVDRLWEIQKFTMCFEKKKGRNVSLLSRGELAQSQEASTALAREYWETIEGDTKIDGLKKPEDLEAKLYYVYARISLMASCLESGLCDYPTFDRMSDAAEVETLLSFSNYLKLAEETSIEWNVTEDLERFLDRAYDKASLRKAFLANRQRIREKNCSD